VFLLIFILGLIFIEILLPLSQASGKRGAARPEMQALGDLAGRVDVRCGDAGAATVRRARRRP